MGHLREKYTKTYFTGRNTDGTLAGYGIEENYNGTELTLRDFDIKILEKINFQNANVLEIGFGRGESIQYLKNKKISSYVGVDFAEPAYDIVRQRLDKSKLTNFKIHCCDALEFLQDHGNEIANPVNIVIMLDVIEHIPRFELSLIFTVLKRYLSEKAVIVINTPVYKFDNDVLAEGLDERNHIDAIDQSDLIAETAGMHCNKYSVASLQDFMKKHQYLAITESHFFVYDQKNDLFNENNTGLQLPYIKLWQNCFNNGFPLMQQYTPDEVEFAYNRKQTIELLSFDQPILEGIKFYGLKTALESFQDDGSIDYLNKYIKAGDVVFDVGSYVGLSALFFAKKVGRAGSVICFEPNRYNLLRIKNNFSANPELMHSIRLYDFGLSDTNISAEMLLSDDIETGYSSASQLVKGGKIAISQSELESMGFYKEVIKLKTLDNFVEETAIIPNLIKVDIEGAEVYFLKGGMNVLKKYKPILFMELHNVFASCTVFQILKELGYQFHLLSEEWGNRVQIAATYNEPEAIGLSNKDIVEVLFQSYSSYKAKLYQENLEIYSKQQRLLSQKGVGELQSLKESYHLLKQSFDALQISHQLLLNSRGMRLIQILRKIIVFLRIPLFGRRNEYVK